MKKSIRKMMPTKARIVFACLLAIGSSAAMAVTGPAEGDFGYDLYDVAVNDMVNGAPGFVGGLAGVVFSAAKLSTNWLFASLGILGSTAVIKADTITTSLGFLI